MSLESIEMSLEPAQRVLSDSDVRIWFWQLVCGIGLGLRIRKRAFARVKDFDFG